MKAKTVILSAVAVYGSICSATAWAGQPQPIAPDQWITAADNLPDASRLGLDGDVSVELAVSGTGKVTDCRVAKSSGHGLLDEHTCQLLSSRARFKPATDENGRPVTGTFPHSVRWQVITNANWAANGFVRAEMIVDPASGQWSQCTAEIAGEISDHMEQMACFVLVNQAKNISAALAQNREAPFKATFVLAVYPEAAGASTKEGHKYTGERIAYANAAVVVSPQGSRSDCRMVETDGPSTLIFPICGPTPQFRYMLDTDNAGANVATQLRQEVAYYVEDCSHATTDGGHQASCGAKIHSHISADGHAVEDDAGAEHHGTDSQRSDSRDHPKYQVHSETDHDHVEDIQALSPRWERTNNAMENP